MKLRILYAAGALLTIAGSFLPWWCEGNFVWHCFRGVRISWGLGLGPVVDDNGGLLVLLLTAVTIVLSFRPPRAIEEPIPLVAVCGVGLVLTLMFRTICAIIAPTWIHSCQSSW